MRVSYAALKKFSVLTAVLAIAACDAGRLTDPPSGGSPPAAPPTAATIVISPNGAELAVGDILEISATAYDQYGQIIKGRDVSWSTSANANVRVNAGRTLEGVATGADTIFASLDGKKGAASVRVFSPKVHSVVVELSAYSVPVGGVVQAEAFLYRANGQQVAGNVYWTSSNSAVATIDQTGAIQARRAGSTTIQAVSEGKSASKTLTVTSDVAGAVATVVVSSPSSVLHIGKKAQLQAVARDAQGRVLENPNVSWKTSNKNVAEISASGEADPRMSGTVSFTATVDGVSGETSVSVSPVPVAAVGVSLSPQSMNVGETAQASVVVYDADGAILSDRAVAYATSDAGVATVSSAGQVSGVAVGVATITATVEGKSAQANIHVTAPPPSVQPVASVSVVLTSPAVSVGGTTQAVATPRNSSGEPLVGRSVSWSSSNNAVATVSSSGQVTGVGAGSANIVATSEGVSGTAVLTVSSVIVVSGVVVSPHSVSLPAGGVQEFTATNLTSEVSSIQFGAASATGGGEAETVTWSATGGTITQQGRYTAGQVAGQFMVIAMCSCGVADTSQVLIMAPNPSPSPQLVSVSVSPGSASVVAGGTVQFSASGLMSDSSAPVNASVVWSATGGTVNQSGLYTAGSTAGTYVVRVTSVDNGGLRDSAVVTVTAPPSAPSQELAALTIDPRSRTLAAGESFKFKANGWYSGSSEPHDTPVVWSATGGTVDQNGNYTAGSVSGTYVVRIQSTLISWRRDSAVVTVTGGSTAPPPATPPADPTVVGFTLTPATVSIQSGSAQQFSASATWSDGVARTVSVTWSATGGIVTGSGHYTAGGTAGTYSVIANCACGLADTSVVTVTAVQQTPPPPPPSGSDPLPGAGSRVIIDTRAGGAHSLQTGVSTFEEALRKIDPYGSGREFNGIWSFTNNIDGNGTRGFVKTWTAVGSNFGDQGGLISMQLSSTLADAPKEVYVQFKHRMGRTATGGGIGELGAFDVTNEFDPHSTNAGRKYLLLCRPLVSDPGGCGGRVDHTWSGPAPAKASTAVVHPNGFDRGMGNNIAPLNIEAMNNMTITFTLYIRAESAVGAGDGIIRTWYNGVLTAEHTGLGIGPEGVKGIGLPTIFRSPRIDQTEYFWDFLVWSPN